MRILTNATIGGRLGFGFTLILMMTSVIATAGIWRLNQVADATNTMMAAALAKERLVSGFDTLIYGSVRHTTAIVKSTDPTLAALRLAGSGLLSPQPTVNIPSIQVPHPYSYW